MFNRPNGIGMVRTKDARRYGFTKKTHQGYGLYTRDLSYLQRKANRYVKARKSPEGTKGQREKVTIDMEYVGGKSGRRAGDYIASDLVRVIISREHPR